uniref:Uncharacterized protein n=1 Tax=Attheya septentrionalis TaxID=420275 RepID=A0A7S2XNM4_9STRA
MFIEFNPPDNAAWGALEMWARALKFFYYVFITVAFCCNILVVSQTTLLSVMGAGLALRGPDGSMMTATDGLYEERKSVFAAFAYGLATTVASVVLCVWLILSWEAALVCMSISIYTGYIIYANYKRIAQRFDFDESQTVTFHDIFDGPAAIRGVSTHRSNHNNSSHHSNNNNSTMRSRRRGGRQHSPYHSERSDYSDASDDVLRGDNHGTYSRKDRRRPTNDYYEDLETASSTLSQDGGGTNNNGTRNDKSHLQTV